MCWQSTNKGMAFKKKNNQKSQPTRSGAEFARASAGWHQIGHEGRRLWAMKLLALVRRQKGKMPSQELQNGYQIVDRCSQTDQAGSFGRRLCDARSQATVRRGENERQPWKRKSETSMMTSFDSQHDGRKARLFVLREKNEIAESARPGMLGQWEPSPQAKWRTHTRHPNREGQEACALLEERTLVPLGHVFQHSEYGRLREAVSCF